MCTESLWHSQIALKDSWIFLYNITGQEEKRLTNTVTVDLNKGRQKTYNKSTVNVYLVQQQTWNSALCKAIRLIYLLSSLQNIRYSPDIFDIPYSTYILFPIYRSIKAETDIEGHRDTYNVHA